MSLFVKICGVGDLGAALTAVEAGADALGFVFYPGSPRALSPEEARAIAEELPEGVAKVAVFLRPTAEEAESVLSVFGADFVQADSGFVPPGARALPVHREGGPPPGPVDGPFIYEGPRSGAGERVDWAAAAGVAPRGEMILAGGLTPANVAEAIRLAAPWGVDVSSGVESEPGVKDPALVREFVRTARESAPVRT